MPVTTVRPPPNLQKPGQFISGVPTPNNPTIKSPTLHSNGVLGAKVGQSIGSILGGALGGAAGGYLLPFKKGGRVLAKRGQPMPILAHGGEVIVPNSLPKIQKMALEAINKKNKK